MNMTDPEARTVLYKLAMQVAEHCRHQDADPLTQARQLESAAVMVRRELEKSVRGMAEQRVEQGR